MKVTQLSTTNARFAKFNGVKGDMTQMHGVVYFSPEDGRLGEGYRTSRVLDSDIITEGTTIKVKTRNSVYVYEKDKHVN